MTSRTSSTIADHLASAEPKMRVVNLAHGAFAMIGTQWFGLPQQYINNFVLLAMAGFFTAIVRAPLTGIVLLFEMSGSVSQMLSLSIVSVTAYIVATLLRSAPIYESLLERILTAQKSKAVGGNEKKAGGQKVLNTFTQKVCFLTFALNFDKTILSLNQYQSMTTRVITLIILIQMIFFT